jgi:hypothetical protein
MRDKKCDLRGDMIRKAKDLLPYQRAAIESLLRCAIAEDEMIGIRRVPPSAAPEWLKESSQSALIPTMICFWNAHSLPEHIILSLEI